MPSLDIEKKRVKVSTNTHLIASECVPNLKQFQSYVCTIICIRDLWRCESHDKAPIDGGLVQRNFHSIIARFGFAIYRCNFCRLSIYNKVLNGCLCMINDVVSLPRRRQMQKSKKSNLTICGLRSCAILIEAIVECIRFIISWMEGQSRVESESAADIFNLMRFHRFFLVWRKVGRSAVSS